MADTPSASKKATPKKQVTEKSLPEQIVEKRAEYLELQKSHAAGELVNPRALTSTRKDIARLMTALQHTKSNATKETK